MTTYTIITDAQSGMLLCCIPDGADPQAAIEQQAKNDDVPAYSIDTCSVVSGCHLADDDSEVNALNVVYAGHSMGWLSDETGRNFKYAIRQA